MDAPIQGLLRVVAHRTEEMRRPKAFTLIGLLVVIAVRPGDLGTFRGTYTVAGPDGNRIWRYEGLSGSTFTAWQITYPSPPFRMSYGMNGNICGLFEGRVVPLRPGGPPRYTDVYRLRDVADRVPLLLDSSEPSTSVELELIPPPGREPSHSPFINRHNGVINGVFLDWSVRPIGLKELYTLKWHLQFDTAGPWTKAGGVKPEGWPRWMRRFKDY